MTEQESNGLEKMVRALQNERIALRRQAAELYRRAAAIEKLEEDIWLILSDGELPEEKPKYRGFV